MIETTDTGGRVLYKDSDHQFIWLGSDSHQKQGVVQTMQYLIIDKGRGTLLDPGGVHLFPRVVAAVSRYLSIENIDSIFFSHQDPDVSSGIALWLGVTKARMYTPDLWRRFLPHFGIMDTSRVMSIEETGKSLKLGSGTELVFIPSHYMHSPDAFSLYDNRARILFSGDIGGAVFPDGQETVFVEEFPAHIKHIEWFHKRLIGSNSVAKLWVENARRLAPDMIAPQHGAIYKGDSLKAFLDWLYALRCGIDNAEALYRM